MRKLTIREERESDIPAIRALTRAAFAKAAHAGGNEQDIIDALRADGDLTLSLVATNMDEAIVGHLAVSPVTLSSGARGWYSGGPLSVMPTRQRTGIGAQLVEEGIERMKALGAQGIVLLGSPNYYGRFGFRADPDLVLPGVPAEYFQMLLLGGEAPKGEVAYARGFSAPAKA